MKRLAIAALAIGLACLAPAPALAARVTATIPLPKGAGELAAGFGSVWSANFDSSTVSRIDPTTDRVIATIHTHGPAPGYITTGAGAVWVTESGDNNSPDGHTVARIDPATDRITARIRVGALPSGVLVIDGSVWVANHHSGTLSIIDPATNRLSKTVGIVRVPVEPQPELLLRSSPRTLAISAGAIWTGVPVADAVLRVSPLTGRIRAVVAVDPYENGACGDLAADANSVFVSAGFCGTDIVTINAHSSQVRRSVKLPVPPGGSMSNPVATGDGGAWVVAGRTLVSLDDRGRIRSTSTLPLDISTPVGLLETAGSLWLTTGDQSDLFRVQP